MAMHAYREIDWDIVHAIMHSRLSDFRSAPSPTGMLTLAMGNAHG